MSFLTFYMPRGNKVVDVESFDLISVLGLNKEHDRVYSGDLALSTKF